MKSFIEFIAEHGQILPTDDHDTKMKKSGIHKQLDGKGNFTYNKGHRDMIARARHGNSDGGAIKRAIKYHHDHVKGKNHPKLPG